jgi:hypothetical protein
MYEWAGRWIDEVDEWPDLAPTDQKATHGIDLIRRCLSDAPLGLVGTTPTG